MVKKITALILLLLVVVIGLSLLKGNRLEIQEKILTNDQSIEQDSVFAQEKTPSNRPSAAPKIQSPRNPFTNLRDAINADKHLTCILEDEEQVTTFFIANGNIKVEQKLTIIETYALSTQNAYFAWTNRTSNVVSYRDSAARDAREILLDTGIKETNCTEAPLNDSVFNPPRTQ